MFAHNFTKIVAVHLIKIENCQVYGNYKNLA